MQSIEKLEHYFEFEVPAIIKKLEANTQPEWGSMHATKMLDHLSDALKLSMGIFNIPEEMILEKAEKYKAITLLSDRPIPKGFDNPILKLLIKTGEIAFIDANERLIDNWQLFKQTFNNEGGNFKTPHNIFGFLNYQEWAWFHYKHFSHHFAQFGLINYVERFSLQ